MFATRTVIDAGVQALGELVAAAGTYCILCTMPIAGGHESVSLVDATNGTTLGTWTTASASAAVAIGWSYTTSPTGVDLVLNAILSQGVKWSGPSNVSVPENDVTNDNIGIQASFSGSAHFAASTSAVTVLGL